jgi:hypothetical protein|tara:strand:- start:14879 stop:17698 length:2820 start_codon:yes stop_codon:yes gene_type:complete
LSVFCQGFFVSKYYSPKEYRAHQQIWDIKQDSNQIIYFAQGEGLTFFDGNSWESIHIGERGRGTALFLSKEGKFYASGQYDFGYIDADSVNNFTYHSLSNKIYESIDSVQQHISIFEDDSSVFFFGNKGLEVLKNDILHSYRLKEINSSISFMLKSQKYFASKAGIHKFENEKFSYLEKSEIFKGDKISFALSGFENNIILGHVDSGLYSFDGINFSKFDVQREQELIKSYIYKAELINDNVLAIATLDGGVFFYSRQGELIKIFDTSNGAFTNSVLDLYLDHENTLWLGLWGGIQKIPMQNSLNNFMIGDGIGDEVLKVASINDKVLAQTTNEIYLGTINDINRTFQFSAIATSGNTQNSINIGVRDNKLVYFNSDGLFELNENEKKFSKKTEINFFAGISDYDNNEDLWIGEGGIYSDYRLVHPLNLKVSGIKNAIKINNEFYFNDLQNIYTYKYNQQNVIELELPKGINRINKMDVINGEVYISVEGADTLTGLYVYDKTQEEFSKSNFLRKIDPDLTQKQVHDFKQCPSGDIWIQNNFKIKKVFYEKGKWNVNSSKFETIGGGNIYTIECSNDEVWFGGVNGVYKLSDKDWSYDYDFKTNITGFFVNRDSLIYGGFGEPEETITLTYSDNEIRFTYAATSYIDPERNTYQYKLDGFDNDWSTWSLETQKDYTNLGEGEYVFKVKSRNVYEADGEIDTITFTILPPWYRTWWAYMLYLIVIAGILYGIYKIRINQILKIQGVRNRIADDLHDDLSGTLIGISNFAKAITKNPNKENQERFIGLIEKSADEAKEKISDIVWTINPTHDEWVNFLTKCRRHASDILEAQGIEYSLEMDENIPGQLEMELRKNLWLIFKEIITNITKHAEAEYVLIRFKTQSNKLNITIRDKGKGFDMKAVESGNGIQNIKKRVEAIDGEVSLESIVAEGTSWIIEVPL